MKILVFLFVFGSIVYADKDRETFSITKSTDGSYYTKSSACVTTIFDSQNNMISELYGHPMGTLEISFWISDTVIIVNSGCCEQIIFFSYNIKEDFAQKYVHKNLKDFKLSSKIYSLIDNEGIMAAFDELENNSKKEKVHPKYLMWSDDWEKELKQIE